MLETADSLDRLGSRLLAEARELDGVGDSIEPLIYQVQRAWEGPAAARLVSELGDRRREVAALAGIVRSLAMAKLEEARQLRSAQAAATSATTGSSAGISPW